MQFAPAGPPLAAPTLVTLAVMKYDPDNWLAEVKVSANAICSEFQLVGTVPDASNWEQFVTIHGKQLGRSEASISLFTSPAVGSSPGKLSVAVSKYALAGFGSGDISASTADDSSTLSPVALRFLPPELAK